MAQAVRDTKESNREAFPTVFHKKNNGKLLVTMQFENWIDLYDSYYSDMEIKSMEERNDV